MAVRWLGGNLNNDFCNVPPRLRQQARAKPLPALGCVGFWHFPCVQEQTLANAGERAGQQRGNQLKEEIRWCHLQKSPAYIAGNLAGSINSPSWISAMLSCSVMGQIRHSVKTQHEYREVSKPSAHGTLHRKISDPTCWETDFDQDKPL